MHIQVNTDDNVAGREALARRIEAEIIHKLSNFSEHITRVEVHLSDEDGSKSGRDDKRCLMEARLAGRQPVAVSNLAASLDDAFSGAAEKLKRALEKALGRLRDHKGRDSIRGNANTDSDPPSTESGAPLERDS